MSIDFGDIDAALRQVYQPENPIPGYSNFQRIDEGSQGIVYRALQDLLSREVAVKLLFPTSLHERIAEDDPKRLRLLREATAMGKLEHPHLVKVHVAGETADGRPYIVMELLEDTLRKRIDRNEKENIEFTPQEAARLVHGLAEAIGVAHEKEILHRDLNPNNVMFDKLGVAKVTDFGLAKELQSTDNRLVSVGALGTQGYRSREQSLLRSLTPATDVFSLGVILYECLTGKRPFPGKSRESQLAIDNAAPHDPLPNSIPKNLRAICYQCLNHDPNSRYENAKMLAGELDRFLQDQTLTETKPITIWGSAWRTVRRFPKTSIGLAASLGLVVVIIMLYFNNRYISELLQTANYQKGRAFKNAVTLATAMKSMSDSIVSNHSQSSEMDRIKRDLLKAIEPAVADFTTNNDAKDDQETLVLGELVTKHIGELRVALHQNEESIASLKEAASNSAQLAGMQDSVSERAKWYLKEAASYSSIHRAYVHQGKHREALPWCIKALETVDKIPMIIPEDDALILRRVESLIDFCVIHSANGTKEYPKAIETIEKAHAELGRLKQTSYHAKLLTGKVHAHHALILSITGKPDEAQDIYHKSIDSFRKALAEKDDPEVIKSLCITLYNKTNPRLDKLRRRTPMVKSEYLAIKQDVMSTANEIIDLTDRQIALSENVDLLNGIRLDAYEMRSVCLMHYFAFKHTQDALETKQVALQLVSDSDAIIRTIYYSRDPKRWNRVLQASNRKLGVMHYLGLHDSAYDECLRLQSCLALHYRKDMTGQDGRNFMEAMIMLLSANVRESYLSKHYSHCIYLSFYLWCDGASYLSEYPQQMNWIKATFKRFLK